MPLKFYQHSLKKYLYDPKENDSTVTFDCATFDTKVLKRGHYWRITMNYNDCNTSLWRITHLKSNCDFFFPQVGQ